LICDQSTLSAIVGLHLTSMYV